MSRENLLLKNTAIITIGRICTQMISFLLLPLYTTVLSTSEFGIVDVLNTMVALLLPIITLQTEQALFRELVSARNDSNIQKKIISTGVCTITAQYILFLVVYFLITPLFHNEYKYYLLLNITTQVAIMFLLQIIRGLGDNESYAIGSFISALSTIFFNILFLVVIHLGAKGMLLAIATGQMISISYLIKRSKIHKYISINFFSKPMVMSIWKYSLPLVPNCLAWWIIDASDRVIVSSIMGVEYNGILAVSLKFATLLSSINYVFTLSWTESVLTTMHDEDFEKYFNKILNIILGLFVSISIMMISGLPFLFPLLINIRYYQGYGLVPISILATLFNVIVGLVSTIYVSQKNTKAIAQTSLLSAALNIIFHLLLIQTIGLYAAVFSSLISFATMSIYRIIHIRKKYIKIIIDRSLLVQSVCGLCCVIFAYYINNMYLNIISIMVAIFFVGNINKNSATILLQFIKKKRIEKYR